jgi:uncharacterized protein YyaL (SSP411 family)
MRNLIRLARITGNDRYKQYAEQILIAASADVRQSPSDFPQMLDALASIQSISCSDAQCRDAKGEQQ